MQKLKLISCVLLLSAILSGCTSEPVVKKPQTLPPPAWMMQSPPDLLTPLSEIIGYSETELQN
ncbi:Rz1 family lipoprotein [Providencia stuartii]|nr:Rz1 family lipoprotein [Providencia stuartii]